MRHPNFTWTPTDRIHELAGEAADDFDEALIAETKRQAAAIRTNALTGHEQTLESLAESLAHRLSQSGVTEHLVRAALSVGPLGAGQMLLSLIGKCIEEDAETAALVELERDAKERAGGLDVVAMRAAAPEGVRVPA